MENDGDNMQTSRPDREKMDTFIVQCQEKMKFVDKSAASLMKSLDLLHATTDILVQQLDLKVGHGGEPLKETIHNVQECKRTAREIIMMLEDTVLHEKVTTVESLRSFLHFIKNSAEEYVETGTVSPCYYLLDAEYSNVSSKHKEKHIQRILKKNEEMQKEIVDLKRLIKLSDDKERSYLGEKKSQNSKIKVLEAELEDMRKEHITLQEELSKKNEEIKSLKETLYIETEKVRESKIQYDIAVNNLEKQQSEQEVKTQMYEEKKVSLRNEIESLKSQTEQQRESIESLQTQTAQLRESKEEIQRQSIQLNENIKQMETDLEASRNERKQKEDELKNMNIEFGKAKEEFNERQTETINEREALRQKCNDLTHENDSFRNDKNRANQLNKELQEKIAGLEITVQTKERENDSLHTSESQLKQDLKNERENLNYVNQETVLLAQQLNELKTEECSLNNQIKTMRSDFKLQIQEKDVSIKDLTTRKGVLEKELESSRNKNEELSENCQVELEEKQSHIHRIDKTLQDKEKMIDSIELEKQNLLKQQQELISTSKEMTIKANQEKDNLEMQLQKAEKDINFLRQEMSNDKAKSERELHQKDTTIKELKRTNRLIYEEKENVSKVLVAVEEELLKIKSKRVLQVQLYTQSRTSLTGIVEQGLMSLLKNRLESEKLELEFVQCAKALDIQPDVPVLLLCITVSRLGTDVANAVQGLTLSPKMAVLIFHHKDVHALPNQDSGRVLTGQGYKNLGGVFDMAFLSGKGIYSCEMNTNNVISLINFINREGVRRAINQK